MKIINKRQTGAEAVPAVLNYGEIAIDRTGCLHTADSSGAVANPLAPALTAVANTDYGVKMLQLESILAGKNPPMLAGFVEGFGNDTLTHSKVCCAREAATHRLKFDRGESVAIVTRATSEGGGGGLGPTDVSATIAAGAGLTRVEAVEFSFAVSSTGSAPTFTLYGSDSGAGGSIISGGSYVYQSGRAVFRVQNPPKYKYYTLEASFGAGWRLYETATGVSDFYALSATMGGGTTLPEAKAEISGIGTGAQALDGSYISRAVPLGAQVSCGEVYLQYPPMPAGASLTPSLGGAVSGQVALTKVGSERTVYVSGVQLREQKYSVPPFAARDTASVRVDGHRASLSDGLYLSDVLVALR